MNTIDFDFNKFGDESTFRSTITSPISLFEHFQDFSFCPLDDSLKGKAKTVTLLSEAEPTIMIIRCADISTVELIALVQDLNERTPNARIILLGCKVLWSEVRTLIQFGVYAISECIPSPENLKRMIEMARNGCVYIKGCSRESSNIASVQTKRLQKNHIHLTAREQQVLDLVVAGYQNREIANSLQLSRETVKTHMRHLLEKFAVTDRTKLAIVALELQSDKPLKPFDAIA